MDTETSKFISLDNYKSKYTPERILYLNKHFKQMVTGQNDERHVDSENDKYHSEMVELFLSKLLGRSGVKHILVTGSASENLKCVSENSQGDADIMFVSKFPTMSKEIQDISMVPLQEPGFYKLKHPNVGQYYPNIEHEGVKYLNANSLREFEPTWFVEDIQLPLLVFENFHHEYEKAERNNVASAFTWTAQEVHVLGKKVLHQNKHYFQILSQNYSDHILPLLNGECRANAEKVLESLDQILTFLCLYGTSRTKQAIKELKNFGPEFENGFLAAILGYVRDKEKSKENFIRDDDIEHFIKAYEYFETFASAHLEKFNFTTSNQDFTAQTASGSFDLVPSISCDGFPSVANEWQNRTKGKPWPNRATVTRILDSGFHLVPKTSKLQGSDPSTSFRIAFSVAEKLLAQTLATFHRECYRVLKMYFYEKLKRDPKVITTYHLKTVFFWVLESTDAKIWVEENRAYCCVLLLDFLKTALEKSNLPHYFIPQNNLFQHFDEADLEKDKIEIEKILEDPNASCGETIKSIKNFYSNLTVDDPSTESKSLLDNFVIESNRLFNTVIEQLKDSKPQDLNMTEEMNINFLVFLTNPTNVEILKFCFDLIFVRNSKAEFYSLFSRHAPLPSPLGTLVQMLLPISDEITKNVVLPQVRNESELKKKFIECELLITIASKLKYEHLLSIPMLKSLFGTKKNKESGEEKVSILTNMLINQGLQLFTKRIFKR